MRQILTMAFFQVRLLLSNPIGVAVNLGLPLIFTAVFGMGLAGAADSAAHPVAVVVEQPSLASEAFLATLAESSQVEVREAESVEEIKKLFADRQIMLGLVLPVDFEETLLAKAGTDIDVIRPPGGNMEQALGPVVQRAAHRVATDLPLAAALADAQGLSLAEAYETVTAERAALGDGVVVRRGGAEADDPLEGFDRPALGFSVMFVMNLVFIMGGSILQERQRHTWGRLLTAPIAKTRLMLGYLLGFYLIGMLQFSVLVAATTVFFDIYWGPLLPLFVVGSAFILCAAGLGLAMAAVVRTSEQQQAAGTLVVIATSFLGGVFWPIEFVSNELIRTAAKFTPQFWAMEALNELTLGAADWANLGQPLAILLGLALVFTAFGWSRVRFE